MKIVSFEEYRNKKLREKRQKSTGVNKEKRNLTHLSYADLIELERLLTE